MKSVLVSLSLVAAVLLAGFYSVVRDSVRASAGRRAESAAPLALKARPADMPGARLALVRAPGRSD